MSTSADYVENLNDIVDAVEALTAALEALKAARAGGGPGERERFVFQIGYARGRLSRVSDRIDQGGGAFGGSRQAIQ
jgi:hypothetical protein